MGHLLLECQIPLLCVAGTQLAIDGKNTLAQPGIRRQGDRLNTGSVRKDKGRVDVVKRTLRHGLEERKLRIGEGSCNPSLFDPDQCVAGPDDRLVSETISDSETWSKVKLMQF